MSTPRALAHELMRVKVMQEQTRDAASIRRHPWQIAALTAGVRPFEKSDFIVLDGYRCSIPCDACRVAEEPPEADPDVRRWARATATIRPATRCSVVWSGRQDLNMRLLRPERDFMGFLINGLHDKSLIYKDATLGDISRYDGICSYRAVTEPS